MISAERCVTGRLRNAYPAGLHDVELRVVDVPSEELATLLAVESDRIMDADAQCRKIVFAAPAGDPAVMSAAEIAGFRYVVDVEVRSGGATEELSLLVREPFFVTQADVGLNGVPGA